MAKGKHRATSQKASQAASTEPTTGPYTWGNGPKPYGIVKRIIKKAQGK